MWHQDQIRTICLRRQGPNLFLANVEQHHSTSNLPSEYFKCQMFSTGFNIRRKQSLNFPGKETHQMIAHNCIIHSKTTYRELKSQIL